VILTWLHSALRCGVSENDPKPFLWQIGSTPEHSVVVLHFELILYCFNINDTAKFLRLAIHNSSTHPDFPSACIWDPILH
jgi:hypothetical protein